MREAGERLSKINKEIKERKLKEEWSGSDVTEI